MALEKEGRDSDADSERSNQVPSLERSDDEEAPEELKVRRIPNPSDPTPAERERHNATHLPYRPWCKICVQAKAKEDPHYKRTDEELQNGIPEFAIDYASMSEAKDKSDRVRMLIGKDRWTKKFLCCKVECKGTEDENVVNNVAIAIENLGYTRIALVTDGEPAILQVQTAIQKKRAPMITVPRNPPAYDPQANGFVERAVGEVKGQIRALKLGLEARLGVNIGIKEPIVEWVMQHAASLLNKFHIGVDGRTAHFRVHHKNFNGKTFEIGEQVLAKPKRKIRGDKRSVKTRWIQGTWVDWDDRTGEHIVVLESEQAVRVRTARPVTEGERWNAAKVLAIKATPNKPNPRQAEQRDPLPARDAVRADDNVHGQDLPEARVREGEHRDFRITGSILSKYGYTDECIGCRHKRAGLDPRAHTNECRQRLEEAIKVEERYKEVIRRRDERLNKDKQDDKASDVRADGPGTPRLDPENERSPMLDEDMEQNPRYEPTEADEDDLPDLQKSEEDDGESKHHDDESESGSSSDEDSKDSDDDVDGAQPGKKKQRIVELKRWQQSLKSEAAKIILQDLEDSDNSPSRMTRRAQRFGMRPGCVTTPQTNNRNIGRMHIMNVTKAWESLSTPHDAKDPWEELYKDVCFYDDITGYGLEQERAVEARKLEMEFFRKMQVYTKVPRSEALRKGHKIISTRWLDVNKGDSNHPDYRSRLVGKEINTEARLDLFAATPPLESLRIICSLCASNQSCPDPYVIMSVDVKRAYFYAKSTRPIHIEIPIEDYEPGDEDNVGMLNLSLYGTRDAAQNWSKEYTQFLKSIGFAVGRASVCNFWHKSRKIYLSVHGDDFTMTGTENQLEWLRLKFCQKYEVKSKLIGSRTGLEKEARILNRTIRLTNQAVEYEPDRRHADLIIKELCLEGAKVAATPGSDVGLADRHSSEKMDSKNAKKYRGIAARLNYLAMDRVDLQHAAKTASKYMASPHEADWLVLKRVAKYLLGAPRCIQRFGFQTVSNHVVTYGDSDWVGKERDKKSTSGGVITWGAHVLKSWSSQQQIIALSSGEAELYSLTKAAAQTKGIIALLADYGAVVEGIVLTDASAALGMVHRQGLGRTRHIDVQYLWIQQEVYRKTLSVHKVGTHDNVADILTKNVSAAVLAKHLETLNFYFDAKYSAKDLRIGRVSADQWGPMLAKENNNGRMWIRYHTTPRRALFTPYKVAKGPKRDEMVGAIRVTVGNYADGEEFVRVEGWNELREPHQLLEKMWIGVTMFF